MEMNPNGARLVAGVDGTDPAGFSPWSAAPGAETPGVFAGDETAGSAALLGVTAVPEVLEGLSGMLLSDAAEGD
jgi:hypothetical protein